MSLPSIIDVSTPAAIMTDLLWRSVAMQVEAIMSLPMACMDRAVEDLRGLPAMTPNEWTGESHERFMACLARHVTVGMDLHERIRMEWAHANSELSR